MFRLTHNNAMQARASVQPSAQGRSFAYEVRFREQDSDRCEGSQDCGHSRTREAGQKQSVKVLITRSWSHCLAGLVLSTTVIE